VPALTAKDKADCDLRWTHSADYIEVSFWVAAEDVALAKRLIRLAKKERR